MAQTAVQAAVTAATLAADVAGKQAANSTGEHLRLMAALQTIAERVATDTKLVRGE